MQESVALAPLTTFGIGGPARFYCEVRDVSSLKDALAFARKHAQPVLILGGGSNILLPDEGFEGLVIKIAVTGISLQTLDTVVLVSAAAGENWDNLVAYAVQEGLWGIENLSGIPGSVGGAVVQNIGAYGAALSEVLESTEVFNIETQSIEHLSLAQCTFDYRDSIFKHSPDLVVLGATFRLATQAQPHISYKDLAQRFAGTAPSLAMIREAVLAIRRGKFPDLSEEGTAGSYFKNPIVSQSEAEELAKKYTEMPLFAMPETQGVKIPLAWLLDNILQLKGTRVGGARLFEKQPLVIAAEKNTSATDVKKLATLVIEKVQKELQIKIEEEVRVVENKK